MTITAYVGLPGSGKSYGVVENVIIPALKQKREIFTNIPMNNVECIDRFGLAPTCFDVQDIIDNSEWWTEVFSSGALIIIDELWRLWPSGLKANQVRESDKVFLAEHRHLVGGNGLSTEVVFVTQDLSQVASFARSLVETTYRVEKLSKVGMSNKYRVEAYFGAVTGARPPRSRRDREIYGSFKKSTFALYKSHTKSETGEAGDEARIDGRFNVLNGIGVKLGLISFFILSFALWQGGQKMSNYYGSGAGDAPMKTPDSMVIDNRKIITANPVPKAASFLTDAEKITIIFNNGSWPYIDFLYRVVFKGHEARFSFSDFQRLGYVVEPINKCTVKISGPDYSGFAMCERTEEKRGWVENIVASAH